MLDAATLRWASLENLERLARSLGLVVNVSGSRERRQRRLVAQIAAHLQEPVAAEQGSGYRERQR